MSLWPTSLHRLKNIGDVESYLEQTLLNIIDEFNQIESKMEEEIAILESRVKELERKCDKS